MTVMGDRGGRRPVGRRSEDREKACRDGHHAPSPTSRPPTRTVLRCRSGRPPGCGSCCWPRAAATRTSAPQPWVPRSRSHVVTFPRDLTDRAEMDAAVADLARKTLAEIVEQGRVGHPRRRDGAHQDVLHQNQDPQAARAEHRPRRLIIETALRSARPVRTRPAGAAARRAAGTGDAPPDRYGHRGTNLDACCTPSRSADTARCARSCCRCAGSPSSPAPTARASRRCTARCDCWPTAAAAR